MELVVAGRAYVQGKLGLWNIGIEDGKIKQIKRKIRGDQVMDFGDKMILPAAIDPHVHFRDPGLTKKEDFSSGSLAAAFGGVSCVFDMPNTLPPTISLEALREKKETIAKKAWVDYGLFGGCVASADIDKMAKEVIGFKLFMGSSTGRLLVTDEKDIAAILAKVKGTEKVLSVHAEDEPLILTKEERDIGDHCRNRPATAEVSAINRLSKYDQRINICHLSSKEGLEALDKLSFTKEVTAHHLLLDMSVGGGAFAKVNPPIRSAEDRNALFLALASGKIDMLGSDHAPHTIEDKSQEFDAAPSGSPGVETTVPLMLALVKKGLFPLDRLVNAMAERPSEVFGLNKGMIEEGRDADLMVVDPRQMSGIKVNNLHSKCGWTLFEDHDAIFPHATFVRGTMVVEDGALVGERVGRDVVGR